MKLIIINFLLFSECVFSFLHLKKTYYTRMQPISMNSEKSIRDVLKYKNYLEPKPLGKLYQDIENHNVDGLYFSSDLKDIYSKKHLELSDHPEEEIITVLTDYSVTNSNPLLANQIIEVSNKNKVETTILVDPAANTYSALNNGLNLIGKTVDTLFFPGIIFLTAFSFFNARRNTGNTNMGGNPFLPMGLSGQINKDKINMQKSNISLSSWAGSPEIFEECFEVVSYLKNATVYKNAGAEVPKGILLEGPPGTGKTLIAKAIASEADANFISVSASEFVELFVGMGAAKVRNLFEQARKNTPCIIFIDEIDSVGRQRGAGINMGNDEREQTLNQLLAEMDGFAQNQDILVIAATNRKDVLDSALLRPGRFDRIINVPLPDRNSRKDILNVYLKNKEVNQTTVNVELLSEMTAGFSGAQIKNLVNEAAINAARIGKTMITQKNIEDALEKIVVGIIKKNDTRKENILQRVAIHEMGHGFLALLFSEYFELKKITIQSTYNGAGGYTLFNEYPEISEGGMYTKDLLKKRLIVMLGGKSAEYVFYDENYVSVGAIQDLKQANSLAQRMIGNFGMGNELKVFFNENTDADRNPFLGRSLGMGDRYSDRTKELFDYESLELINEAYHDAVEIIRDNKLLFTELVHTLQKNVTLYGNFIKEYVDKNSVVVVNKYNHDNNKFYWE